jgi:hypothetical protein
VASTEKVSLSIDTGSLLLARRAAEIEGMSLSAWVSELVRRYAWASQRPKLTAEAQARADERTAAMDDEELWGGQERRAAG